FDENDLDFCRDFLHKLIYFPWWRTCSYGWVLARDGGMILMSIWALFDIRCTLNSDDSSAYQSLTVWYRGPRPAYVPPRYVPGRQWRRRRMGKLHCFIRRFIVVKGIYTERQSLRYLRRHLMGRLF
ncbi:unnamed protein product, partial [Adineta ricciae]